MNYFFTLLGMLVLSGSGVAQPILSSVTIPPSGTEITSSSATGAAAAVVDPGPGGENLLWDFSAVQCPYSTKITVDNPANSPYASSFPNATMVLQGPVDEFYSITPSQYTYTGYKSDIQEGIYSNPFTMYVFPMIYGQTFTDTYASEGFWPGGQGANSGTSTITYDAYGALKTPYGDYQNVVRIKATRELQGISYQNGTSNSFEQDLTGYYFFSPGVPFPLAEIVERETSDDVSGLRITYEVKFYDLAALLSVRTYMVTLPLFLGPNPATDQVLLDLRNALPDAYTIEVIKVDGTIALKETIIHQQGNSYPINLSGLAQGVYFVNVYSNSGSYTQKLVKSNDE